MLEAVEILKGKHRGDQLAQMYLLNSLSLRVTQNFIPET